jgi:pimeloyl-ACP methyl ester carboxylesterase
MRKSILLVCSLLLISYSGFALKPKTAYINTPKDFGIPYSEQKIPAAGATLNSWLLQQPKNTKAPSILMCNSDYGNMSYLLESAAQFYKMGFNVILFDYRGFGSSSAFRVDSNQLYYDEFVQDFTAVARYYQSKVSGPIIVYGQSMGTIVATIALSNTKDFGANKFLFESFIESLDHSVAVLKAMKHRNFSLPKSAARYNACVQSLKSRTGLIFVGSEDSISSNGKLNYKTTKWRIVPYKGGHLAAAYVLKDAYFQQIRQFAF